MPNNTAVSLSWISLGFAVVLLVSPWLLGFSAGAETVNSVIGGVLVGAASILSIMYHRRWDAWANLVLLNLVAGAWVFMSPLLFHYNENNSVTWIQILVGIAVSTLATVQMWRLAPSAAGRLAR